MKKLGAALFIVFFVFQGCSGENGVNGVNGESVNADSLASVLRDEITMSLWDSLYAKPYIDSVYELLFNNAFSDAWMDSTREALLDSLNQANYDSLYNSLYDSVYADIFTQSIFRSFSAQLNSFKADINMAFANQYPLMYKDFKSAGVLNPQPISVKVTNNDKSGHQVLVKAWVPNYSDTGIVTKTINSSKSEVLGPPIHFFFELYKSITAPTPVQIQVRTYALENNREILIHSFSQETTLHPMQVFGNEYISVDYRPWYSVWVTPNMDSITSIYSELSKKLPGGTVMAYQLYSGDASMAESSRRVIKAVYEVLQSKGIRYVNNTSAGSPGQKIKYPVEVLQSKQANCIEGATLFASILESLGMQAFITIIPGHAFLGWRTDNNSSTLDFLETTLTWNEKPTPFSSALKSGNDRYQEEVSLGNFTNNKSYLLDIQKARKDGIKPGW